MNNDEFWKPTSSEPLSQLHPNLAQSIIGWREIKLYNLMGYSILRRETMIFDIFFNQCAGI